MYHVIMELESPAQRIHGGLRAFGENDFLYRHPRVSRTV
jgi:hypothetical protein